jgi:phage terminase small subunit
MGKNLIDNIDPEEIFCQEFIIDLNATAAYKRIHPNIKDTTAAVEGCKYLRKPNITNRIKELMIKRSEIAEITAIDVLKGVHNLATADLSECQNPDGTFKRIHDIPKHVRLAINSINYDEFGNITNIKLEPKTKNWENVGRHVAIKCFTDKFELPPSNGAPATVEAYLALMQLQLENSKNKKD